MNQEYEDALIHMSNKEAAEIIKQMRINITPSRGSGKTAYQMCVNIALNKAILLLNETPDIVDVITPNMMRERYGLPPVDIFDLVFGSLRNEV